MQLSTTALASAILLSSCQIQYLLDLATAIHLVLNERSHLNHSTNTATNPLGDRNTCSLQLVCKGMISKVTR
jgi:hypothetical protein